MHSQIEPEEEVEEQDPKIMIPQEVEKHLDAAGVTLAQIMTFVHSNDMPANATAVSTGRDTVAGPHQVTGKLFAKNSASALPGCFTVEDTTPDDADHKEFYLEKVQLKQTGLANDKKKHYIHHLLVIFKAGGDTTNTLPGWGEYEEED